MKELANYLILITMLVLAGNVSTSNGLISDIRPIPNEILSKAAMGFMICIVLLGIVNYLPKKDSSSK